MSRKKEAIAKQEEIANEIARVKLPRGRQVFGIVEQRLGGTRMRVRCMDNKTRICRIPGRLKRKLWVREGDTVLVEPWELSSNDKGDVIFKYKKIQMEWLRAKGHIKELTDFEEF
ncbi:MAG: translation initiation factor eIF-1A [Nanoarchaeota archaeon]|nr:MAG: translation initiation factor eIF-1A [Nanoarchaeota archaeon]